MEERDLAKKVSMEKANNKLIIPILLLVISILTYIIPLMYGEFDFGLIFETIALVLLVIAKRYIVSNDEKRTKRYIICSMLLIGWLLIYDIIWLILYILEGVDLFNLTYNFFFGEIFSIGSIAFLYSINKDLSKTSEQIKYENNKNWFYEENEGK